MGTLYLAESLGFLGSICTRSHSLLFRLLVLMSCTGGDAKCSRTSMFNFVPRCAVSAADARKLEYTKAACEDPDPFGAKDRIDGDVLGALEWIQSKAPDEIMEEREAMMSSLEEANRVMRETGLCDAWFGDCDPLIKNLCQNVNGHLAEQLALATGFCDPCSARLFKEGAPMYGNLKYVGIGAPASVGFVPDMDKRKSECARSNDMLVRQSRADAHADELLRLTRADSECGRMAPPELYDREKCREVHLSPRFCDVRSREDGTLKMRPIDHLSWAGIEGPHVGKRERKAWSVNGHTALAEKMRHDTVDALCEGIGHYVQSNEDLPYLMKRMWIRPFGESRLCHHTGGRAVLHFARVTMYTCQFIMLALSGPWARSTRGSALARCYVI